LLKIKVITTPISIEYRYFSPKYISFIGFQNKISAVEPAKGSSIIIYISKSFLLKNQFSQKSVITLTIILLNF